MVLSGSQNDRENDDINDMEIDQRQASKRVRAQNGTPNLQLRLYQREMLDKSIQKNIIIAVWGSRFQSMIQC